MSCYTGYIAALRAKGYRLTPQRTLVLEALFHHGEHMSVNEVYDYVHAHSAPVNRSTVYRALHFLTTQGLVTALHYHHNDTRYAAVKEQPHAHAICQACGVVTPVDLTLLEPAMRHITRQLGFQVMAGRLELPGLCQACAS
jgi:Fur family ferric uptake transcriptional regulator